MSHELLQTYIQVNIFEFSGGRRPPLSTPSGCLHLRVSHGVFTSSSFSQGVHILLVSRQSLWSINNKNFLWVLIQPHHFRVFPQHRGHHIFKFLLDDLMGKIYNRFDTAALNWLRSWVAVFLQSIYYLNTIVLKKATTFVEKT